METYGYCPGNVNQIVGLMQCLDPVTGQPIPWVLVEQPVFSVALAELSTTDIAQLLGAALVVMVLAYGFKLIRQTIWR